MRDPKKKSRKVRVALSPKEKVECVSLSNQDHDVVHMHTKYVSFHVEHSCYCIVIP